MTKKIITIEVSKTVQVAQFEPVTVKVTETVEVGADQDASEVRFETYKTVTQAVKKYIDNEVRKYTDETKAKKRRSE